MTIEHLLQTDCTAIISAVTTALLLTLYLNRHAIVRDLSLLCEFLFTKAPKIAPKIPILGLFEDEMGKVKQSGPHDAPPGEVACYDKATFRKLGTVEDMSEARVWELCAKAKAAQKHWSASTSYAQRRLVLRTIQKYMLNNIEPICEICAVDSGKPLLDALLGEILPTAEKIRTINRHGADWLKPEDRVNTPMLFYKNAEVQYEPYPVLGIIAPWNYPFHNFMNHIISGIFAGCGVVVKVSEYSSYSAAYFVNIVKEALSVNGFNPDLVQVVTGFAGAGQALVACSDVDKILFTGSPGVGRKVMEGASHYLKPVVLELGGKDPMIFTETTPIADCIAWSMRGVYQNAGQNCCGVERLLVYSSIFDEFISKIVPLVENLKQGNPTSRNVDCGAMCMPNAAMRIQELIDDAVKKGAVVHCGGKLVDAVKILHPCTIPTHTTPVNPKAFYPPTIISHLTSDMRIFNEEVFGPVMCIFKVPNDSDDECIKMANACEFGLGASVYCRDIKRAQYIGKHVKSGMVTINDFGCNYLIQSLPFGGVKESGFDRFAGKEGLRGCCYPRAVVNDKFPSLMTTSIPPPLQYPVRFDRAFGFGSSLVHLFYEESVWMKVKEGIIGLIKWG